MWLRCSPATRCLWKILRIFPIRLSQFVVACWWMRLTCSHLSVTAFSVSLVFCVAHLERQGHFIELLCSSWKGARLWVMNGYRLSTWWILQAHACILESCVFLIIWPWSHSHSENLTLLWGGPGHTLHLQQVLFCCTQLCISVTGSSMAASTLTR